MSNKIFCQLTGQDGNAFAVMGRVMRSLKRAKVSPEKIKEFNDKATSGDYDNLLAECISVLEENGIEYE